MSLTTCFLRRTLLPILAACCAGCAVLRPSPSLSAISRRYEANDRALRSAEDSVLRAIAVGHWDDLAPHLTPDARLELASGTSILGRDNIIAMLKGRMGDSVAVVGLRGDWRTCDAEGFRQGRVVAQVGVPSGDGRAAFGGYSAHWTIGAGGAVMLDRVVLARITQPGLRQSCEDLRPRALETKTVVALVPTIRVADAALQRLQASRDGWTSQTPLAATKNRPSAGGSDLTVALEVRRRLAFATAELGAELVPASSGMYVYNETYDSGVTQHRASREFFGALSWQKRWFRIGVGPSVVLTHWETANERRFKVTNNPETLQTPIYTRKDVNTTAYGVTGLIALSSSPVGAYLADMLLRCRVVSPVEPGPVASYPGKGIGQYGCAVGLELARIF